MTEQQLCNAFDLVLSGGDNVSLGLNLLFNNNEQWLHFINGYLHQHPCAGKAKILIKLKEEFSALGIVWRHPTPIQIPTTIIEYPILLDRMIDMLGLYIRIDCESVEILHRIFIKKGQLPSNVLSYHSIEWLNKNWLELFAANPNLCLEVVLRFIAWYGWDSNTCSMLKIQKDLILKLNNTLTNSEYKEGDVRLWNYWVFNTYSLVLNGDFFSPYK